MKIQNVKGGYDYLPKEQIIRNYINDTLESVFKNYGYLPIETPILCYYDMLAGKYDEDNDILNEIYKLRDQGNRLLGLRYDLTVPFAKFIALNKNNLKMPFKRYEISKVFRDGPVKLGRDREFTQCDIDVVGIDGELIEAELINIYVTAFNKLGITPTIKYNSRKLMNGLILLSNIEEAKVPETITIIDKINKLTKEEFIESLEYKDIPSESINKLLIYFNMDLESLSNLKNSNPLIKEGLKELINLTNYLKELELTNYIEFDSSLARGQDYYTGNVFEVYAKNTNLTSSIGGGGRYDKMITDFINDGTSYPAVGISFGLTSIYELLKEKNNLRNPIDIYIIPIDTQIESLKLANKLRSLNYNVELDFTNKKVKKSLDFCNKESIPYVIILGEDEIKSNIFKVKDMQNKKEYTIPMDNISLIKSYL